MLVVFFHQTQNIGLGRIIPFNYKKFKSTFVILSFLFSMFGCGDRINSNTHLTAFADESGISTPSSSLDNENISDSTPSSSLDNENISDSTPSSSAVDENISDSDNSALDNSVKLSWVAPIMNANGTKLTDLGGYIVYYGEKTGNDYAYEIDIGNTTFIKIDDLSSGTWCFAVSSYDIDGNESDYSFEACKSI